MGKRQRARMQSMNEEQFNHRDYCDVTTRRNCGPNDKDSNSFELLVNLKNISLKQGTYQMVYEFLGAKVETSTFLSSNNEKSSSSFEAKEDIFQINIPHCDLLSFMKDNLIKVVLYKECEEYGNAFINLFTAFNCNDNESSIKTDYFAQEWIEFDTKKGDCCSFLDTATKNNENPKLLLLLSLSNHTTKLRYSQHQRQPLHHFHELALCHWDNDSCNPTNDDLLQKLKEIARVEMELDTKQREWMEYQRREEQSFRQHLREKEIKVQEYLEKYMKQEELKQMKIIENCRIEYKNLESRLKTALADVEAKEREMKRIVAANNTTFVQKITELDLKEKLIREEAQHLVDMEVGLSIVPMYFVIYVDTAASTFSLIRSQHSCLRKSQQKKTKLEALREKMKMVEGNTEASKNRANSLEKEVSQLQKKIKNSDEAKAIHGMNVMRTELEETKLKLKQEVTEKNALTIQRDEYRHAAHKLVSFNNDTHYIHESSISQFEAQRHLLIFSFSFRQRCCEGKRIKLRSTTNERL